MDAPDHILIVDDDAEIRSLLSQYLVKNGLRATAVAEGRAMWQALDAGKMDLIVLDLMLPGDDGPGIAVGDLEKVFEPFYRLEGSRNRETGGTGLGLSIARSIAQAHGGELSLRNHEDQGLEAVLTLPWNRETGAPEG